MSLPIDNFNLHIKEIRKLHEIFSYTSKILTPGIDISGILRAEIVFSVSALDQYIHSLLIHQAIEILNNNRPHTESFYKLAVGLNSVKILVRSNNINDALKIIEKELSDKLAWRSFQHPDKITEALKMISNEKIWEKISEITKITSQDIKEELKLIVKRRDSIVHEADFNIVNRCQYDIDEALAKRSVNFIITLAHSIDSIIFNYTYNNENVNKFML